MAYNVVYHFIDFVVVPAERVFFFRDLVQHLVTPSTQVSVQVVITVKVIVAGDSEASRPVIVVSKFHFHDVCFLKLLLFLTSIYSEQLGSL